MCPCLLVAPALFRFSEEVPDIRSDFRGAVLMQCRARHLIKYQGGRQRVPDRASLTGVVSSPTETVLSTACSASDSGSYVFRYMASADPLERLVT